MALSLGHVDRYFCIFALFYFIISPFLSLSISFSFPIIFRHVPTLTDINRSYQRLSQSYRYLPITRHLHRIHRQLPTEPSVSIHQPKGTTIITTSGSGPVSTVTSAVDATTIYHIRHTIRFRSQASYGLIGTTRALLDHRSNGYYRSRHCNTTSPWKLILYPSYQSDTYLKYFLF